VKEIHDILKNKKSINRAIRKYGYFAEHNFLHFLHCENSDEKNVFFDYGRGKGILTCYDSKNEIWELFPCGVLAPEDERSELMMSFINHILKNKKAKKLVVEVTEDTRRDLLYAFKTGNTFRARTYTYVLSWPLYNMKTWNPKLKGNKMKKLRNIRNRFNKNYRIRMRNCEDVPKEDLRKVFDNWMRKRRSNESVDKDYYLSLIESNFKGLDVAKVIYINGNPASITAGWKIPNSNNFYSAIGIMDYSYPGISEITSISDLNRSKKAGFDYVDFGGSDKELLNFKMKFKPEKIYKTFAFSIVRN